MAKVKKKDKIKVKSRSSRDKAPAFDISQETKNSIMGVASIIFGVLSILSFFGSAGKAGGSRGSDDPRDPTGFPKECRSISGSRTGCTENNHRHLRPKRAYADIAS